ncbi:MAG: zf-HC2 domain-containing protein [Dethiobacter sp.]|jgi:anti-sigma factor RsiW|nr:zf-HC2 domain-containing protein [Dethiobacter sp.]
MTCELVREVICEYIDGELDIAQLETFESHLEYCMVCRREVDELRETLTWLKQAEEISPPAGLRSSVLNRLKKDKMTKNRLRFAPGFSQAVAAAAIFVFLVAGNLTLARLPAVAGLPKSLSEPGQNLTLEAPTMEVQGTDAPDAAGPVEPANRQGSVDVTAEGKEFSEDYQVGVTDARAPSGLRRLTVNPRVVLNALLLPLFVVFSWLAVRKKKEA